MMDRKQIMIKKEEIMARENIILYGAGSGTSKVLRIMQTHKLMPVCVADANPAKWGKSIEGIPIISPDAIKDYDSRTIIIASCFFDDIYIRLQETLGEELERYDIRVAPFLWLMLVNVEYDDKLLAYSNQFILQYEKELYNIYDINDAITKEILDFIVKIRKERDFTFTSYMQNKGMQGVDGYFYLNELNGNDHMTILDLGAYVGDTIDELYKLYGDKICRYYAYEPEEYNYRMLCDNIKSKSYEKDVIAFNKALGARREEKVFAKSSSMFGVTEAQGEAGTIIRIVPLDEENLNIEGRLVIKMDVEGLELDILKGGMKYIKKYKPYMAICVYHHIEDIYTIPRFLEQEGCKYRYILRSGVHTHLVAIPEN